MTRRESKPIDPLAPPHDTMKDILALKDAKIKELEEENARLKSNLEESHNMGSYWYKRAEALKEAFLSAESGKCWYGYYYYHKKKGDMDECRQKAEENLKKLEAA